MTEREMVVARKFAFDLKNYMPTPKQDRFEKADAAFLKACRDVNETYAAWNDACNRLQRIGKERLDAWEDLVETLKGT